MDLLLRIRAQVGRNVMSSGQLLNCIQCPDTRKVMRAALAAGFVWVGYTKSGHVEIRWPATGQLLHCATTPSDPNSWKQFAREVKKASGVEVWRKGNRRRSHKPLNVIDLEVEASRRRHAEAQQREESVRLQIEERRRAQALAAARAAADERRRREIEDLMQPRWGR